MFEFLQCGISTLEGSPVQLQGLVVIALGQCGQNEEERGEGVPLSQSSPIPNWFTQDSVQEDSR